jgi:N-acetylglucosaminyldiphosphoundecaprenol N-acetyl-beta-D-mannosaminyltransferase
MREPAPSRQPLPPLSDLDLPKVKVVGTWVHALNLAAASDTILTWAQRGESRLVCACNVHMVMEAHDDPAFQSQLNQADMVLPDGMPIAWALRASGHAGQPRVTGPDLMLELCAKAEAAGLRVGLHGGAEATLEALVTRLKIRFPRLQIAYAFSPPYRPPSEDEDRMTCGHIAGSEVSLLFVGLGCPKQEKWMAEHAERIPGVLLGVGAAFDFHAGTLPVAPQWMRSSGLEWMFRLLAEPRRLWKRYFKHNPRYLALRLKARMLHACRNRGHSLERKSSDAPFH